MTETRKSKIEIDWGSVRKRLVDSEAALGDTMTLSEEEIAVLYTRRAAQLAKRHNGDAISTTFAVLVFRIGKESYAIDLTELAEILSYTNCTPVPDVFPALLGLINLRGEICPVFDLARLMELDHAGATTGYVLMVRNLGTVIGFRVDQIEQVRDLRREEIEFTTKAAAQSGAPHLKGVTHDTLMLIDTGSLMRKCVPTEMSKNRSN